MESIIKDPSLASHGSRKIDWAASHSPVMNTIREELLRDSSVKGRRIGVLLPIEPKTAYLTVVLTEAGAQVALGCPGNLVKDDVAAGLVERGVTVFAKSDATAEEQRDYFGRILEMRPEAIIDDRAELVKMAHTTHREALGSLLGITEQTTSGINKLRSLGSLLSVPCIAGNDAKCKHLFDNRYGTGQSVVEAILDSTNLLLAGKLVVVVGYGWVGKGIAKRARGMGARIVVTEIDPFAALEAWHDGFFVSSIAEACAEADVIITTTGCPDSLSLENVERCKDGVLLANAGAVDNEFDTDKLRARAIETRWARPSVEEFKLDAGRSVFVIGAGIVVNLSAGEGHPVEIMDLTFAVQALAARHLLLHAKEMPVGIHRLPEEVDERIARTKLASLGVKLDELNPEQREFFGLPAGGLSAGCLPK
jgi:adenosylhomocysteinase